MKLKNKLHSPPRKSTLKVVIENMDPDQLAAVERELKVLIDTVKEDDFESAIEPELNLLRPRAFLAELKVEFQRWERYETPLLLAVCSINAENVSWQDVGREFKHLAKMTDIIGCFPDEKIAGIFPGESGDSRPEKKISNRLKERFGTKISLSFNCVPEDLEQYSSLEKQVTG